MVSSSVLQSWALLAFLVAAVPLNQQEVARRDASSGSIAAPASSWLEIRQDDGTGETDSASSTDPSELPTTSTATIESTILATSAATGVPTGGPESMSRGDHRPTGTFTHSKPSNAPSGSFRAFGTGVAGHAGHPTGQLTGPPTNIPTGVPKFDGKDKSFSMDASMSALLESFTADHPKPTGIPTGIPSGFPTGTPTGIPSGFASEFASHSFEKPTGTVPTIRPTAL